MNETRVQKAIPGTGNTREPQQTHQSHQVTNTKQQKLRLERIQSSNNKLETFLW